MNRRIISALVGVLGLTLALTGFVQTSQAQDFDTFYHWPYVPPQVPSNGYEYNALYDGWYLYPREQRIVPQIQGPFYRNYYGGKKILGLDRHNHFFSDWTRKRFYKGHHFILDVF